jgi:hypothetical protein
MAVATVAERQKVSPPTLAKAWGLDVQKIIAWIRSGELRAINAARSPTGRARFLIDKRDIEAFEQARAVTPPAARPARRRRSAPAASKTYF